MLTNAVKPVTIAITSASTPWEHTPVDASMGTVYKKMALLVKVGMSKYDGKCYITNSNCRLISRHDSTIMP